MAANVRSEGLVLAKTIKETIIPEEMMIETPILTVVVELETVTSTNYQFNVRMMLFRDLNILSVSEKEGKYLLAICLLV